MSIINSTGIYDNNSELVDDVEQLKIDVDQLQLDFLNTAAGAVNSRVTILETNNTTNQENISILQSDNTSNITRIVTLETDNTSNIERLDNLELDNSDNKLRLDDAEAQIFDVVHEPNIHEDEFFYYTPYPVPYDVLEAYSQLIHSKSLTLKDRFDESETNDIKAVTKVIQEILQDHEMKIVAIEFFNTLSEAKAAAQFLWAGSKVLANKFGKKIIQKLFPNWSSLLKLDYTELTDITDKTLNEVIDELDNLTTIFKYENNTFGTKGGIKATDIYFTADIDKIHVKSTITDGVNDITFSDGTTGKTLNKYLDIKDNHPIDRISDKITLKYNTTQFKTGAAVAGNADTSYLLELNNIMGKVDVKDNHPIDKILDKLTLKYNTTQFKTGAVNAANAAISYQLELNDIMDDVKIKPNNAIKKTDGAGSTEKQLFLDYDVNEFMISSNALGNELQLKIKASSGLVKDVTGLGLDLPASSGLEVGATGLKINLPTSSGLEIGTTGLKVNLYPLTSGLELNSSGLKINTGTTSGLVITADGISINPTYKTELTTLKTQAQTAATASETAKDAAVVARTAAQTSATAAGESATAAAGSATAASTSAGTAGTEATAAAGSAGAAAGSAGAAAGSAGAAAGSAGAAAGSATAAAGSAGAAAGSAGAAAGSAGAAAASVLGAAAAAGTAVALGLSGKADAYHYHSQYLETSDFDLYKTALNAANIVKDTAWDTKLDLRWKINPDTSIYFDTTSGAARRVGIGKANPSTLLDVNGTINATSFTLNGSPFTGGTNGVDGLGWTSGVYNSTTGRATFNSSWANLQFSTDDLRGLNGNNGKGWTGASYNATTGMVTFASNDAGYALTTGDLRGGAGANGKGWTGGSYAAATGIVSFASNDAGYAFSTGDLRGAKGLGFKTGSAYNASTGIVTFLSDDGLGFTTGDLRGASGATITTTQLSGLMNLTTDFSLNTVTNKIDLTTTKVWNTAQIPTLATSKITGLDTAISAMGTLQPKIISTAGQLIIGNGDGITTTSTGLTWTGGNTLNATNLTVSNYATITQLLTSVLTGGVDMFELRNNVTNSLRFNQTWMFANDMKWTIIQKSNNVDYPLLLFRNGKIAIGTNSSPAYTVEVVGDINLTGEFRKNGTILKPAGAVLADTATALATARNIAGVAFNGTADIAIDYFALNNKPIILQPTTTNLQLISGYTFSVPGNVSIGTTAIATNVLQVGAGGRLRIANGTTDYTMIGTIDAEADTNTKIVISGNTRTGNLGNIQYYSTASGGNHIFYTSITPTTRMTISASGVNINNDLGVSGNIGFGVAPSATYKLNVLGDINCSGAFRVAGTAIANSWSAGTPTTNIYYNLGNVGIGNTAPTGTLCLGNSAVAGSDGFLLIGKNNGAGGARTQRIGYNSAFDLTIGDYGGGTGPWVEAIKFSYAAPASSLVVSGAGNVSMPYNLNVGSINTDTISSRGTSGPLTIDPNYSTNNFVRIWDQLQIEGSLYVNGTIQAMNAFYFPNGIWCKSNDGMDRFHFGTNGTTWIKAGSALGNQIFFRNGSDVDIGWFQQNLFYAYVVNMSDRRIKRDIVEINDETALNMLLQVQPTTYYYRDEARNKGNGKVYGFIAQQIKEVIPDAVTITQNIIANIYKTCLVYNKREIYHSIPQDVAIDTEVQIFDKEGGEKGKRYKIKEIYEDHFVIDEDIDGDDCFVFGYCINDLHGLDKSYIYTLNVCATQELHRRMEAQNVIIKSQDERIKELEAKMEQVLKYIS